MHYNESVENAVRLNNEPMELCVPFKFRASHSLSTREEVHSHDWGLKVFLKRKVYDGESWVVDIMEIRKLVKPMIDKIEGRNLNTSFPIPTCEHLCRHFMVSINHGLSMLKDAYEVNEEVFLVAVSVELMESDEWNENKEWGSVKLMNPWGDEND
jgi:6-pyruvoyl-tetrahydropterin synthase